MGFDAKRELRILVRQVESLGPAERNRTVTAWYESIEKRFGDDEADHAFLLYQLAKVPEVNSPMPSREYWTMFGFAIACLVLLAAGFFMPHLSSTQVWILRLFAALFAAFFTGYTGNRLALRGKLKLPWVQDNPIAVGAIGGAAVFLLVLIFYSPDATNQ